MATRWRGYKPLSFELLELAEGDAVLDVGCGDGEDARALALRYRGVAVAGVDASEEKIAEAQRLTLGLPWPVEFRVADAHRLPFEDGSFDACRADRVFHHLEDPAAALAELVRVARPGARIVVSETDFDTFLVDGPPRELTRRVLEGFCRSLPHPWLGRRLPALFRQAGLGGVEVHPYTAVVTEYEDEVLHLRERAERAREAGGVTAEEAAAWLAEVEAAAREERFLCALTVFTVRGRRT